MKIKIVHEKMKSRRAQRLVLKITNLLNFAYLPVRQNLMSIKQLSRYSLKDCWVRLGKFGHTNRKGDSVCILI